MKQNLSRILSLLLSGLLVFNLTMVGVLAQEDDSERVFEIATDTTFAPFEFIEDGEYIGIDMDILAAIAENQAFEYTINPLGFNAALQALESAQVDGMIAGMGITEEREAAFDFSEPYFQAGVQFAVLEDSDIHSLEDLEGQNVAVKTGTTGAETAASLQEDYGFTITSFEDSVNMYQDLEAGNSAAVIEDYPVMAYAAQTGDIPLRFIGEQEALTDFGFAVPKGENTELLEKFNAGLSNLKESGELDEIIAAYLGDTAEVAAVEADTENADTAVANPEESEPAAESEEEKAPAENILISLLKENWNPLISGLWTTIWVTLVAFGIALVFGILLGLMRTSQSSIMSILAIIYIDIMRGIPLIVLSFFIYFGIPNFTGLNFNAVTAGILTLSLNAAAYIAEIVRAGIQAVNPGQTEAGRSLGLNNASTLRHIVLPQAFRIMIPSFINQFVITLKDTSILSVIGLVELTQTGRIIIARNYQSGNMWLIVGAMYIVVITILTKISNSLERKK